MMFGRLIAATLVAAALLGCVATTSGVVGRDTPVDLDTKGVVLMGLSDRALFTATGVEFEAVDSQGGVHRFPVNLLERPISPQDGKGSRYFGVFNLPPGQYSLMRWRLIRTEGGWATNPPKSLSFPVKAGDVTYLGNFNAIRPLGTGQFRNSYERDVLELKSFYPWLGRHQVRDGSLPDIWWSLPGGKNMNDVKSTSSTTR